MLLAGGVVVVDYASLVVFNPCEALLLDLLEEANANVRPKHLAELKSARRFAVYSAAISAGSCLGYLITAVHWQNLGVHIGRNQVSEKLYLVFFKGVIEFLKIVEICYRLNAYFKIDLFDY